MKKRVKGFSLLELLLVIATGSILVIGIISIIQVNKRNNQVDETIALLHSIKNTIIRSHIGLPTYAAGNTLEQRAARAGTLLATNIKNNQHIITSFSNADNAVVITSTPSSFDITLNDVPQYLCIKLFTVYDNNTAGFDRFLFNGVVINDPTPSIANDRCLGTSSSNQLTWRFR